MKHKIYNPSKDVQPPKKKMMSESPMQDLISKVGMQYKGLEPSELFSYFTANIINENKLFTR